MQLLNKTSNMRKRPRFSSEPFAGERQGAVFSRGDSFKGETSALFISSCKASQTNFALSLPYPVDLSEICASIMPDNTHFLPLQPDTSPRGAVQQRASLLTSLA